MLNLAWHIALVVALATFAVETGFVYCITAKRLLDEGILPVDMKALAYFWLVVGYVGDILFNVTRGTWIFRELPKEWLFSSRVGRLCLGPDGWRKDRALTWAALLNSISPGHVRLSDS